ncbi:MAG TPA: SH3 domain-containing protein, partial [Aggregatilineales bacterium]|nr:SH3 domain-containing protein [Aggregatilineales bacterium]
MARLKYVMLLVLSLAVVLTLPLSAQAQNVVCPGTAPSFISVGKPARVTITTPGQISIPLKVHAQPSLSGAVIGQLADATPLSVLSGPNCADHYTWWQIQSPTLTGAVWP